MSLAASRRPRLGIGSWGFIALMLVLTGIFVWLGVWQVNRLAWKEGLIAEVNTRLTLPPEALPASADWPGLDLDGLSFHPVTIVGHFLPGKTVLVFTSLGDAKGRYSGPGYWVLSGFAADAGGTVFVNRGFVPQASGPAFAAGDIDTAEKTLTGIAIAPEAAGAFTPAPDLKGHIEWVRDPLRLAAMAGVAPPVLGVTIDLPAGASGALPQGGETLVDFPNNHLGYVFTWFGFALLTPALLAYWIWRQLRPKAPSTVKSPNP